MNAPKIASARGRFERDGFTLIELLVVIAVIAILVALLIPAVQKVREAAARTQCANNLHQFGIALQNYDAAHHRLPPGAETDTTKHCIGTDCRGISIYINLLPYIEQGPLYQKYNRNESANSAGNTAAFSSVQLPIYTCPSDSKYLDQPTRRTYYFMVGGKTNFGHGWRGDVFTDGLFNVNTRVRMRDIIDGTSNTLAMGESMHPALYGLGAGYGVGTIGGASWWYSGSGCNGPACGLTDRSLGRELRSTKYPINSSLMPLTPDEENEVPYGSPHMGGAQFVYADGHVAFLENTVDMNVYRSLGSYKLEDNLVTP